jgi:polyhydroxyalkanoate synthesis repressor PhaR
MLDKPDTDSGKKEAVVIKKYANRRLYNTETSSYVTLEDLAQMVRLDREFVVCDAKTGDDLTHQVLTQIIVEQESRAGGQTLLPVPFLRQLIRFYDDSMARLVPGYLQMSLETLTREQERYRSQFANAWGPSAFEAYQEQTRRNMQLFEQAMKMWTPFGTPPASDADPAAPQSETPAEPVRDKTMTDIEEMKSQLAAMQAKIEKLSSTGRS